MKSHRKVFRWLMGLTALWMVLLCAGWWQSAVAMDPYYADEFSIQGTLLVSYIGDRSVVQIPNGVTEIGSHAFSGKSGGTLLDPKGEASRIEVAAMVMNYCKKFQ